MNTFIKKYYSELSLSLLFFAVVYFLHFFVTHAYLSDGSYYNGIALAIKDGSGIITHGRNMGEDIGMMYMPGYSYILAFVYLVFGESFSTLVIFHVLLAWASVLLFYRLLTRLTTHRIALLGGCLFICAFEIWRFIYSGMLEVPTVFFLTLFFWALYAFVRKPAWQNSLFLLLAGFTLVAVNNRFVLHVLISFAVLLLYYIKHTHARKMILLLFPSFLILMLPWHIRQYNVYNQLVIFGHGSTASLVVSGMQTPVVLSYEDCKRSLIVPSIENMDSHVWMSKFTPEKYYELLENKTLKSRSQFIDRIHGFFQIIRRDFRLGYGHRMDRIMPPNIYGKKQLTRTIYHVILFGFLFLMLIPSFILLLNKRNLIHLIAFVFLFAHVLVHSIAHYIPRYRLSIIPVLIILAIWPVHWLYDRWRNKNTA